ERIVRARVKLADLRERVSIARGDRPGQPFRLFPEMLEGRIVGQRTRRHSDLLARARRAGGLWSAASGEEVACLPVSTFRRREGLALSADWKRPVRSSPL